MRRVLFRSYEAPGLGATIGKIAVIAVVILAFSYRLAQHKGIPSVLIWVLIVIMVYGYITSNTTVGRYFYAVGGNEKARQPVQIHIHVQIAPRRHILCRRCRLQYEILSAPNKLCHTSILLTNRADSLSNIGKTLYIVKRKICDLELRYFMSDIETY